MLRDTVIVQRIVNAHLTHRCWFRISYYDGEDN